jgi:YVTN family beta-propeller protein
MVRKTLDARSGLRRQTIERYFYKDVDPVAPLPCAGAVSVDAATDTIYAANDCGSAETCSSTSPGTVSVINGTTNTVTDTITVGQGADAVAVDQVTDTIYVANGCFPAVCSSPANTVSVINGATNLVTATINVGLFPSELAVDETTDTVYVAIACGSDPTCNSPGSVSVIDGSTNTVTTTVNVGINSVGVAVD